jgi:hypothetical protein
MGQNQTLTFVWINCHYIHVYYATEFGGKNAMRQNRTWTFWRD